MKTPIFSMSLLFALAGAAAAATLDQLKEQASVVARSGSVAAGFAEVSQGAVDEAEVERRFAEFGPDAVAAAKLWAHDEELADAPPAFRRFLYFEYLTKGTDVVAAASNPDDLLINADSAVDRIFDSAAVAAAARKQMAAGVDTPQYEVIGGHLLATFPMVPPPEKAAKCIGCHASKEVGRPYADGARVLGYTFVLQPL